MTSKALHLLEDVLGWVAVLSVSIVMMYIDLPILDPILSIIISIFVLINVYKNMKEIIKIILQGIPEEPSLEEIKEIVVAHNHVKDVHDIHFWTLDGVSNVITFHMAVDENLTINEITKIKKSVKERLKKEGIDFVTIDIENLEECSGGY